MKTRAQKGKLKVKSINDFTSENVEIEIKCPAGVDAEKLVDALYAFTDCEVDHRQPHRRHQGQPPGGIDRERSACARTPSNWSRSSSANWNCASSNCSDELHYRTLERIFIEERIYKLIEKCKTNEAVIAAVYEGFKPFKKQLVRDIVDADVEKLLQVRIRRISLFDINKHREEMEKTKAELDETRKNLKNLTKYVIGHLEALLEKYGPQYPRLTTKSARHEEVDVKAVAFKAFKVAYDRESGYVGYKVSGEEFKLECTKFDKILLVFKDGTYKVTELPEKLFVGPELFYCGLPDRERVFTCAYTDRKASYLKRFKFGGTILNKAYLVHPGQIAHPVLRAGHAEGALRPLQARAAPEDQPADVRPVADRGENRPRRAAGRFRIKDISSVTAEPTRGWDEKEATTKIVFA